MDRLLSFEFEVVHVAGRTLRMAVYLSRPPTELHGASLKVESLWKKSFTVVSVISVKDVLEEGEAASKSSAKERNSVNRVSEAKAREPINAGRKQFAGFK